MKCRFFFLVKNSKCGLLIILPSVLNVNNSTPDTLVGERRVRQVLHVVALISRLIVFHPKVWNLSKRCRHMSLHCYHFLNTSSDINGCKWMHNYISISHNIIMLVLF